MAMEEEYARVVGFEPEDGIRIAVHSDDIAHGRLLSEAVCATRVVACSTPWAVHYLELVSVKVEGMDSVVMVVYDDVDNVSMGYDERVDIAIDYGIGVVIASRGSGIQGWDFLRNVGLTVDTSTTGCQHASSVSPSIRHVTYRPIPSWSVQKSKFIVSVWVTGPNAEASSYGAKFESSWGRNALTTSVVKLRVLSITSWPVKL
jgi:hypothetical protein